MPQYPSCDGSPGFPGLTDFRELLGCGASSQTLDCLRGHRQCEISRWPDVRAAEHHQKIDVGSPMANSFDLEKLNFDRGVIHRMERFQIESPIDDLRRKMPAVCRFLTAKSDRFQCGVIKFEESLRRKR